MPSTPPPAALPSRQASKPPATYDSALERMLPEGNVRDVLDKSH